MIQIYCQPYNMHIKPYMTLFSTILVKIHCTKLRFRQMWRLVVARLGGIVVEIAAEMIRETVSAILSRLTATRVAQRNGAGSELEWLGVVGASKSGGCATARVSHEEFKPFCRPHAAIRCLINFSFASDRLRRARVFIHSLVHACDPPAGPSAHTEK